MIATATLLAGAQIGFSFMNFLGTSSATKSAKKDMESKVKMQRRNLNINEANKLEAMQQNYLMGIRDINSAYVESTQNISNSKQSVDVGFGVETAATVNYDANKSSYFSDAETRLDFEYDEAIFSNTSRVIEDNRRASEMNQEAIGSVIDETQKAHMDLSIEQTMFDQEQDNIKRKSRNDFVTSSISASIQAGAVDKLGKIEGRSLWGKGSNRLGETLSVDALASKYSNSWATGSSWQDNLLRRGW